MPVVIPDRYKEQWIEQFKNANDLKTLLPLMMGWSSDGWIAEKVYQKPTNQMSLF